MMLKLRLLVIACVTIAATIAVWALRPTSSPATNPGTNVEVLLTELRRADRTAAEVVVAKLSKLDRLELRELSKHIGHENPNIQRGVALALANAPPLEIETAKALQQGLRDSAVTVREQCLRAIGKSEWKGPEVAVLAAGFLKDPSWEVRCAAAIALGEQGESARPHIPALNKVMREDWSRVGEAAASACRRLGKFAVGTEPGLWTLIEIGLDGADEAIEALGEIQTPEALHILILTARGKLPTINQGYPTMVDKACRAIAKFGAAGRPAIHTLELVAKKGSGQSYSWGDSHEAECKAAARDAILAVDPAEAKAMGLDRKRE